MKWKQMQNCIQRTNNVASSKYSKNLGDFLKSRLRKSSETYQLLAMYLDPFSSKPNVKKKSPICI